MTPFSLSRVKFPAPSEDNRQKSLDMVKRWNEAQKELERVCAEQGIPVPVMVC